MTLGPELLELEVPEHRPGFFDDLRAALDTPSARPRVRLLLVAAALVVAATAVGVLVTRGTREVPPNSPTPGGAQTWTDFGSNPWGDHGRQTTVQDLRAGVPEIPLPNSPSTNDDNAGTVWVWGDPSSGHVAAAIYYPQAKIELLWTATGLDYTGFDATQQPTIDGVHAILLGPETYGSGLSVLNLPVGPDHVLMLEGLVPTTDLVSVAKTLAPSPGDASPAGDLPPADPKPGPQLTFWEAY